MFAADIKGYYVPTLWKRNPQRPKGIFDYLLAIPVYKIFGVYFSCDQSSYMI